MDLSSTIVAIASAPGAGLHGLVRASGVGCHALLGPDAGLVAAPRGAAAAAPPRGRVAQRVRLRLDLASQSIDLPAWVVPFPAPRGFTGEDAFEILCCGHPAVLEATIEALERSGDRIGLPVRRAEPGEFSLRAFQRGRIDLSQAEGIAASIAAESDRELAAAARLRDGALHRAAESIAESIAELLARVEAGIDFADEEDVVAIPPEVLAAGLDAVAAQIDRLLARRGGAEAPQGRPIVLLVGPPNAGKSALFNALLGRRRSVESPSAGTTRDAIAEPLALPGAVGEAVLVDAAGEESVDAAGDAEVALVQRAMQAARGEVATRAALRLRCHPADSPSPWPPAPGELLVLTKVDLLDAAGLPTPETGLATSARTGRGLDDLRDAIALRLSQGPADLEAEVLLLLPRHEGHLATCRAQLAAAAALAHGGAPELLAAALREALDEVAAISGRIEPDDLLGRIFSRFCIGK